MTRMIKFLSIAVVLFSVAAGASWYLQKQQHPPGLDAEEKGDKAASDHARVKPVAMDTMPTRPLLRPSVSPEAERLTRMTENLQAQQESLKSRERQLADREKQVDLIHDQIKNDQKKLDTVRKDVETELQLVQEKLETLERRASETKENIQRANATLEDAKNLTLEVTNLESKNLKQLGGIYDKMEPEIAAQNIQQMTEKGKLDTAVTILANMRDRNAASVLGEVSKLDPTIAVQLFDRMRYTKAPGGQK